LISSIARNIQKNISVLSSIEAVNSARSLREVKDLDIASIIKSFYYYAGSCSIENDDYEPLGVVAIFGHHDSSLLSVASKLACALSTGNTCLVVPSHVTPLGVFMLAEICVQSGVPPGVLNVIVNGTFSFDEDLKFQRQNYL
jgi:acyl-CoA reductase-like NAD-dependent aldehyde dehydrogenase